MKRFLRRGLTLAEALLSVVMVSLVLGLVANMTSGYSRVVAMTNGKNRLLQAARTAIVQVTAEAREGVLFASPGVSSASTLEFTKLDPGVANLPAPPAAWDPCPAGSTVSVRYFLQNERLFREVTPPSGAPSTLSLAEGLTGFDCQFLGNGNLQVRFTVLEMRQVTLLTSEVRCPMH